MTTSPSGGMVTVDKLAKRLAVSRATVFWWVRRGLILPGTRVGQFRVWTDSEARTIIDHVAQVRWRLEWHPPVRVAHGKDNAWACSFCGYRESRSAPVSTHMRSCLKVWNADEYRGKDGILDLSRAPRTPVLSRKALADFALRVIDGEADMDALAAKVKARLDRIAVLEGELRVLRSKEDA